MTKRHDFEPSTGNVFADLGLANPQEALMKAELVRRISEIIEGKNLTQAQAAALLRIDQPKISTLLRGKLSGFSTDRLLRFLNLLDQDVRIEIQPKPKNRARARMTVSST